MKNVKILMKHIDNPLYNHLSRVSCLTKLLTSDPDCFEAASVYDIGYDETIPFLKELKIKDDVIDIIKNCYENLDGSGPNGCSYVTIGINSRILRICISFDKLKLNDMQLTDIWGFLRCPHIYDQALVEEFITAYTIENKNE